MRGPAAAESDRERQLVERQRLPVPVERTEGRSPLLRAHLPDLLEPLPQQGAGGLVVEDQDAVFVDKEGRRREARHEVACEDQLERLLSAGHETNDTWSAVRRGAISRAAPAEG